MGQRIKAMVLIPAAADWKADPRRIDGVLTSVRHYLTTGTLIRREEQSVYVPGEGWVVVRFDHIPSPGSNAEFEVTLAYPPGRFGQHVEVAEVPSVAKLVGSGDRRAIAAARGAEHPPTAESSLVGRAPATA